MTTHDHGPLRFTVEARTSTNHARLGVVETPHGSFPTPAFMPVATAAAMKGVLPSQVRDIGAGIILNNAYHLMLRPGIELLERFAAVHASLEQIQIRRFQPQPVKRRVEVRFWPPLRRRQGERRFLLENRMPRWLLRLRSVSVPNSTQRMP